MFIGKKVFVRLKSKVVHFNSKMVCDTGSYEHHIMDNHVTHRKIVSNMKKILNMVVNSEN